MPVVWANGQLNENVFCRRMAEWMVSGWNECDLVAWALCNTGWTLNCSQLLWGVCIYIYTMIGVCDRETREWPERDKREKTGIKSVRFEDCFLSLTGMNGSKEHTQQTSQQHYICNNCNCYVCAEWSACRSDSFPAQYHVLCSCSRRMKFMNYWYFWFLL